MRQKAGAKFLILFGLPFVAVGVGTGFFSLRTVVRAQAMLAWRETPAQILSCELKSESDSEGGTTYRVEAAYAYEFGGRRYTADRVSLHGGSDNIGHFQGRAYRVLQQHLSSKRPTVCWVNPRQPDEAILFRRPRPEMLAFMQLFMLAFGGAGLAVMGAGLGLALRKARERADDGLLRMRGASTYRVLGAVALLWNGYAAWLLWTLHRVLAPEPVPWYLWSIAAVGALLAAAALYWVGRHRKYGVSLFALSPAPGVVGGPVSGQLRIPAKVEAEEGFELRLKCLHRTTTTSGGESSTQTSVQWEDARHAVAGLAYGEETVVPVRFAVPFDQPETSEGESEGYTWRLLAIAKTPGIDYRAEFDVPVKRTAQSAAGYGEGGGAAPRESLEAVVKRLGLRHELRAGGGFELVFPAARAKSMIAFMLPFTAGWSGLCYALWFVLQAPLLFPVVFTLFDLLFLTILVNALLVTRGIAVDRAGRACTVWSRVCGIKARVRHVAFDEILDFQCTRSGSSGNTIYFRIALVRRSGLPLTVADDLPLWNDAERVAGALIEGVAGP